MTWFTRSDILEIFRDAQDVLVRKSYARWSSRTQWWWDREKGYRRARRARDRRLRIVQSMPKPLPRVGTACACCDRLTVRVVNGFGLCESHALVREGCIRGGQRRRAA